uniref:Uncharacterized protein n=1 Tax=Cucumis melo TaxID=3656 RepID=A0A9I9DJN7_CUCME
MAANVTEATMVDTAITLFFGSKIGKEEAVQGRLVAEGPAIRRLGKHHYKITHRQPCYCCVCYCVLLHKGD